MKQILPNSTIGVFGSGQLGRMFTIEARKMGYRVHTFSPDTDTPTGQVADFETSADYNDLERVEKFARSVDVVTFEFENVPSKTVEIAAGFAPVHPKGEILHTTQNRLREKTFLLQNGFPIAPFRHIKLLDDLYRAANEIGVLSETFNAMLVKIHGGLQSYNDMRAQLARLVHPGFVATSFGGDGPLISLGKRAALLRWVLWALSWLFLGIVQGRHQRL